MYVHGLCREILIHEAERLSQPVKEFTENCVVCWDTGEDPEQEAKCSEAYAKAVDAIDKWMKLVVTIDMIENRKDSSFATLVLLDGSHGYSTDRDASGVVDEDKLLNDMDTSIGYFNYYIYRCLVDIKDNPVELFMKAMSQQIKRMHTLITLTPEGYNDDILNPAILDLCGIEDPLGLWRVDTRYSHVEEFFEAHGVHEGWQG